jgi:hypothetical protein
MLFSTEEDGHDLRIFQISPNAAHYLRPTKVVDTQIGQARARVTGIEVGGVRLGLGATKGKQRIEELSFAAQVEGMMIVDDNSPRLTSNTVTWKMMENPHAKTGVPTTLRTAIIIRRRSRARFLANVHIVEDPPMRTESVLQYIRGLLGAFQEEPLAFDPEGGTRIMRFTKMLKLSWTT